MIHEKVKTVWDDSWSSHGELLGWLPVFDEDFNAITYYSCRNEHPEAEYNRVVPCFHIQVSDDWTTCKEDFFFLEKLRKGAREKDVLLHEIYRDDYIKNFNENKFVVLFVGCDDGDKVMRFKDREAAIEFLECTEYYDEIFDTHDMLMEY